MAASTDLDALSRSWERQLRALGRSQHTLRNYLGSVRRLSAWLAARDLPDTAESIEADDITDWVLELAANTSRGNAQHHHRNLRAFWAWAVRERILAPADDPMTGVPCPTPDEVHRPPMTQEQVSAMLATCGRSGLRDTRDAAIIRVLADTGMRLAGLTGLSWSPDHPGLDNPGHNDIFLDHRPPLLRLRLKGGRQHFVDISPKTTTAIDRYLRHRAQSRWADLPALWLGQGALTRGGVQQMLNRRARDAGINESVYPHRFRRSMATWHLTAGGTRDALMARAGWSSEQMIRLYTSDSRDRLAWAESQKLGIAQNL